MSNKNENMKKWKAGFVDVFLMGFGMVGGGMTAWPIAMGNGIGMFYMMWLVMTVGYICVFLCFSEMSSIIPFPGGTYGYVRCTMGPLIGFIAGCSELLQFSFRVASVTFAMASTIQLNCETTDALNPMLWCLFLFSFNVLNFAGRWIYWKTISVFSIGVIGIILMYIFINVHNLDFNKWAFPMHDHQNMTQSKLFYGNIVNIMITFRYAGRFYLGIDLLSLTVDEVEEPRVNIPRGILSVGFSMIIFSLAMTLVAVSQEPGIEMLNMKFGGMPTAFSFMKHFNLLYPRAMLFTIPGLFADAVTYMYALGRQSCSMAESGLLPAVFKWTIGEDKVPWAAQLICSSIILAVIFVMRKWGTNAMLYDMCVIGACVVYICMFFGFIVFRKRFANMERKFVNPLGTYSAWLGILVFTFIFCTEAGWCLTITHHGVFYAYICFQALMIVYYYAYAESNQYFSEIEQKKFMKAYIHNANNRKKYSAIGRILSDLKCVFNLNNVWRVFLWTFDKENSSVGRSSNAGSDNKSTNAGSIVSGGQDTEATSPIIPTNGTIARVNLPPTETEDENEMPWRRMSLLSQKGNSIRPEESTRFETLESRSAKVNSNLAMTWSGKVMDIRKSRQFFQILNEMTAINENDEAVGVPTPMVEVIARTLPEEFIITTANYETVPNDPMPINEEIHDIEMVNQNEDCTTNST